MLPIDDHGQTLTEQRSEGLDDKAAILIVDDREDNLSSIAAALSRLDVEIVTASSGEKALEILLDRDFAAILMDVQMPGLNGFETAEIIRQREATARIPIIFVTAIHKAEAKVFEGYSIGAVDYIFKPLVPEIIRSKIQVFMDLYRKNIELQWKSRRIRQLEDAERLHMNRASRYRDILTLDILAKRARHTPPHDGPAPTGIQAMSEDDRDDLMERYSSCIQRAAQQLSQCYAFEPDRLADRLVADLVKLRVSPGDVLGIHSTILRTRSLRPADYSVDQYFAGAGHLLVSIMAELCTAYRDEVLDRVAPAEVD